MQGNQVRCLSCSCSCNPLQAANTMSLPCAGRRWRRLTESQNTCQIENIKTNDAPRIWSKEFMTVKRILIATLGIVSAGAAYAQNKVVTHHQTTVITKEDTLAAVSVKGVARPNDVTSTAPQYTVTAADIARLGITDISDALHRLPGVTLRDYGGAGGMKTVSVRGFGAQHTAVVYDGVALSDCQSGQIDVSRYTLNDMGGLSLVVGDNDDIFIPAKNAAAAASLHISTAKMPSDDSATHLTAQMKLGAWGYTNPFLKIEKNLSDKLGLSIVGDYIYAENDYPYTIKNVTQDVKDRRNNSRMNSGRAELNMVYRTSDSGILLLKAYYYDNSRQLPGMVHYYVNESREKMRDQNAFAQLGWRGSLTRNLRMALTGKFNYMMTDYKDPSYPGGIKNHQYWQREAYASACLLYSLSPRLALDYSADYAYNNLSGSDVSTYRDPLRHTVLQSLTAKYSSGRITAMARLLHSLYMNGARRGDAADDVSHLSPSVSVNWQAIRGEQLYIRLSYKDIFRSPSFNELYYEHYGSTSLKPERTSQLNLGATWRHAYAKTSAFTLTADIYYNNVKDKIVAVPYNMFIWTNINMGRVRTIGVDATAAVTHRLSAKHTIILYGNYTHQKVTNQTPDDQSNGNQIAYTPEHTGSMSAAWENPWVNVSVNGIIVSSRWPNNEHYRGTMLNGYQDFGATLYRNISLGKCQLNLRFYVKNIFNKQYEIVGYYPMPGRSWMATVGVKL